MLCVDDGVHAQNSVETDKAALVALYNATDGANWDVNTNWTSEEPLSSWSGVSTNSDGRVTRLILNRNGLDGTLPAALGDLSELERLDLRSNDLTGSLPSELANLTHLTTLLLNESRALTGALPDGLRELSDLATVNIEETELCAPDDDDFQTWLDTITFTGLVCPPAEQSTVDVAIFYTPAVLAAEGGLDPLEMKIDLMVAETNTAYNIGGVNQRINVVAIEEVTGYTEATSDGFGGARTDLLRLQSKSDGRMDEVHGIRDAVGADVVVLLRVAPPRLTWGMAYWMNQPSTTFESSAFAVSITSSLTLAHELGHIMGLRHDRYDECPGGRCVSTQFPYVFGYVNQRAFDANAPSSALWYTLMATDAQCVASSLRCSRLFRFSNPDQIHPDPAGDPLGNASLDPTGAVDGPSDAVRWLNRTRGYVADFRVRGGDTPTVSSVEITSPIPVRGGTTGVPHGFGDEIAVTVTFSEDVFVTGSPQLTLRVGDDDRQAEFQSVTEEEVLFRYRVGDGDLDTNGVSIEANSLSLNGGTIKDGADNDADLDHRRRVDQPLHKVDGIKPAFNSAWVDGERLSLIYNEALASFVLTPGLFVVSGGSFSRTVKVVSAGNRNVTLRLFPWVEHGETGIQVTYTVPTGMGEIGIQDLAGNDADGLSSVPVDNETDDETPPTVTSVEITSDPPDGGDVYGVGDEIEVTVTFSETVTVWHGTPTLTLKVGDRNRSANYESVTGAQVVFTYTVAVNDIDTDGVSIEAGEVSDPRRIVDLAGNFIYPGHPAVAADTGQKVDGVKPALASTNGAAANGTTLTLAYSEPLDSSSVPGTDAFSVTGGSQTRTVTNVGVNGSAVQLTLDSAVENTETGLRVSYTVPTGDGASPIQDPAGNDADRLSNRSVANLTGDTTAPTVQTLRITSSAGSDSTYAVGESIGVTVTFTETVVVTGTPELTVNVGGQDRTASYLGVSGSVVKFDYQVVEDDQDADGVSIDADSLSLGGGTIRDGAQNDVTLTHSALAASSSHKVDGVKPTLATIDGAVVNGDTLTLAYSEPLSSSSRPPFNAFTVKGGTEVWEVRGVRVSGSAVLLELRPSVDATVTDLQLSYQPVGNPIKDVVGNAAAEFTDVSVTNRMEDTTGPLVNTVRITSDAGSDGTYAVGETIELTVTFTETVVVTGTPRLTLNVGSRSRTANYKDVAGAAVRFEYQVVTGDTAPNGISVDANRLSGGTIRDGARNDATLTHAPLAADSQHRVDGVKPALATSGGAVVDGTMLTLVYGEALDSSSVPGDGCLLRDGWEPDVGRHQRPGERERGGIDRGSGGGRHREGPAGELHGADGGGSGSDPGHGGQRRGPVEQPERHQRRGRHDGADHIDDTDHLQCRIGPDLREGRDHRGDGDV